MFFHSNSNKLRLFCCQAKARKKHHFTVNIMHIKLISQYVLFFVTCQEELPFMDQKILICGLSDHVREK